MQIIITFYLFIILTFSVPNVFSYGSQKARLYDLLKKPLEEKAKLLALEKKNVDDLHSLIPNQNSNSDEVGASIHIRNNWDSGEDYYFQWAKQNRRPVEYLTGRKRDAGKVTLPRRDRRINGGLWRSGLVG